MRIGWLDHSSSPGGGQLGLLRYLRRPGLHEHRLYVLQDGWLAQQARGHGIPVVVDEDPRLGRLPATGRLVRAAREENDVVVANGRHIANLAAVPRHRGAAFLAYLHEDLSAASMAAWKRAIVTRVLLPSYHGLLANSEWTASTVPSHLRRLPLALVYTLSGVDGPPPSRARPAPAGRLRVLSLSRLEEWKGVHVLIEALAKLTAEEREGIHVTVAGSSQFSSDRYARRLQESATRQGLPVTFLGHVDDVDELLQAHDVLVHGAIRPEPFGQVIVQALHAGLAVVATDGGGARELVRPGVNGILTPHGDAGALAAVLSRWIGDPAEVGRLSQGGPSSAARFADPVMAALLDEALGAVPSVTGRGNGASARTRPWR